MAANARRGRWAGAAVLIGVAALSAAICWRWKGQPGLLASGAGIAMGCLIAWIGHALRLRARRAEGPKVVPFLMAASFASFVLFGVLALALAFFWKDAAAPVLLSALAIYLGASFHEVLSAR